MQEPIVQIVAEQVPEDPVELVLRGMSGILHQRAEERHQLQMQKATLEAQLNALPTTSIIADGQQKEIIAILNALYASGRITNCTKAEYMQRMAYALGVPDLANNYAKNLYNIKLTNKYNDIFTQLADVAKQEQVKDN